MGNKDSLRRRVGVKLLPILTFTLGLARPLIPAANTPIPSLKRGTLEEFTQGFGLS